MKNKYSFAAYIIMAILIFIIAIALILAFTNIKSNKTIVESNDEAIMGFVTDSVELCSEAYESGKATDKEMNDLNDYIENIEKYDNVRTKANITLAMLTNTADMLADKYSSGYIRENTSGKYQRQIAFLLAGLENALKFE